MFFAAIANLLTYPCCELRKSLKGESWGQGVPDSVRIQVTPPSPAALLCSCYHSMEMEESKLGNSGLESALVGRKAWRQE